MDTINKTCMVCGNPKSKKDHTIITGNSPKYYCSEKCNRKGTALSGILLSIIIILFLSVIFYFFIYDDGFDFLARFVIVAMMSPFLVSIIVEIKNTNIKIERLTPDTTAHTPKFETPPKDLLAIGSSEQRRVGTEPHVPKIQVPQLKIEVLVCCYQTARFGKDNYCMCGRTIPMKLKTIFMHNGIYHN